MDFHLIANTYLDLLRVKYPELTVKYSNRGGDVYTQDHLHMIRIGEKSCYVHYEESRKITEYYVQMEITSVEDNSTILLIWVNNSKLRDFSVFSKQVSKYAISTGIKVSGVDNESDDTSQEDILKLLESYVDSL